MNPTRLSTKNIYLREFKINDWPVVHRYASQELVCRYQAWGPNTEKESQNYVKQVLEDAKQIPRSRYAFAIIQKQDEKLIGAIELSIDDFTNRSGEIGYVLHPDYWGKGIATEAAHIIIGFGFSQINLHRIVATCDPRNVASARVLEKVGMVQEGRLRDHILLGNGWRDSFLYSILEKEYMKERSSK